MKSWPVNVILQKKHFYQKKKKKKKRKKERKKNVTWRLVPSPFLISKESSVKRNLILTNFDRFTVT